MEYTEPGFGSQKTKVHHAIPEIMQTYSGRCTRSWTPYYITMFMEITHGNNDVRSYVVKVATDLWTANSWVNLFLRHWIKTSGRQ